MRRIVAHTGRPGEGFGDDGKPDAADKFLSANQISRYMPFRQTHKGWTTVMQQSAKNAGDHRVQWGEPWGVNATKSHAISEMHGKF